MHKVYQISFIGILTAVSASFSWAAELTIPHTFQADTAAVAAEVNSNFDTVSTVVNDNHSRLQALESTATRYDFKDYIGQSVTQKTFDLYHTALACDRQIHNINRNTVSGGTQVLLKRSREDSVSGKTCQYRVIEFFSTPEQRNLVSWSERNPINTASEESSSTVNHPVVQLTSTMQRGLPWGDASGTRYTPSGGSTEYGHIVEKHTLLGVESVDPPLVPAGPFADCLKIHTSRENQHSHFRNYSAISWYCRDVGLVRRIVNVDGSASYRIKLMSYSQ